MNTPSHALLAAALHRPLAKRAANNPAQIPSVKMSALLVGSFLPDFLLTVLSIIFIIRDMMTGAFGEVNFEALEPGQPTPPEWLEISLTMRLFDDWFFNNPWIISIQNVFHSPLLLLIYLAVGYWLWRKGTRWAGWFFWMSAAAMLHTLLDIPLHVDDGPLLLFPLDWTWRFRSPISYWDPEYYGQEWSYFEGAFDIFLIGYLLWIYRNGIIEWFQRLGKRGTANV